MLENSTVVNSPTVFYFECVYSSIMPNYVEKLWANVCFFYYSLLMTNELWWVWSFLNLYKEISSAQVFLTKGIEIFRSCQILKIILTVPLIFILFSIGRLSIVWKKIVCSFFFFVGSLEWKLNVCWCFDCYQFTTILSCLYKPDLKHTKNLEIKNAFI